MACDRHADWKPAMLGKHHIGIASLYVIAACTLVCSVSCPAVLAQAAMQTEHVHPRTMRIRLPKIKVVDAVPGKTSGRGRSIRGAGYAAFSTYEEGKGYRIFYSDTRSKKTYEIQGVGLPWRPFSDLEWQTKGTLAFDCWANPHHGTHYEFDPVKRRLSKAVIFNDAVDP
jgi:hypothetical protein